MQGGIQMVDKKRSGLKVMLGLIGMIKPLLVPMRSEERRVGKEC